MTFFRRNSFSFLEEQISNIGQWREANQNSQQLIQFYNQFESTAASMDITQLVINESHIVHFSLRKLQNEIPEKISTLKAKEHSLTRVLFLKQYFYSELRQIECYHNALSQKPQLMARLVELRGLSVEIKKMQEEAQARENSQKKELNRLVASLQGQVRSLQASNRAQVSELKSLQRNYEMQVLSLQSAQNGFQSLNGSQKKQIQGLKLQVQALLSKQKQEAQKILKSENRINGLEQDNQILKQKSTESNVGLKELEDKNSFLEKELQQLKKQNQTQTEKVKQKQTEFEIAKKLLIFYQKMWRETTEQNTKLKQKLAENGLN